MGTRFSEGGGLVNSSESQPGRGRSRRFLECAAPLRPRLEDGQKQGAARLRDLRRIRERPADRRPRGTYAARSSLTLGEQFSKLRRRDIRPAQDQRYALAFESILEPDGGRQRRRAGGLRQVAGRLDHQPNRGADFGIRYEEEVVEMLPEDALRQLEGSARRQAFRDRAHPVLQEAVRFPRLLSGW